MIAIILVLPMFVLLQPTPLASAEDEPPTWKGAPLNWSIDMNSSIPIFLHIEYHGNYSYWIGDVEANRTGDYGFEIDSDYLHVYPINLNWTGEIGLILRLRASGLNQDYLLNTSIRIVPPAERLSFYYPISDCGLIAGFPFEVRFTAVSFNKPPTSIVYSIKEGPANMTISDSGNLNWSPSVEDVGEHRIEIEVSDGKDRITHGFNLTAYKPLKITLETPKNGQRIHGVFVISGKAMSPSGARVFIETVSLDENDQWRDYEPVDIVDGRWSRSYDTKYMHFKKARISVHIEYVDMNTSTTYSSSAASADIYVIEENTWFGLTTPTALMIAIIVIPLVFLGVAIYIFRKYSVK